MENWRIVVAAVGLWLVDVLTERRGKRRKKERTGKREEQKE